MASQENSNAVLKRKRKESDSGNFLLAMIGGAIAAVFGACVWLVLVIMVAYRAGYLLPGIGYLVGKVIHKLKGDGHGLRFGAMGASFAFFGCFFANFLYVLVTNYNSEAKELIPGDTRQDEIGFIAEAMLDRLRPSSIVLYGFAIYLGYTMSYKEHVKLKNE